MEDLSSPATKGDLAELKAELTAEFKAEVNALRASSDSIRVEMQLGFEQITSEANHRYNNLVERIADTQTELLKAFYGYAQGNNKRVAELEGNEGAFRSRLATIEDRILEVERRLNIPPAA